MLQALNALGHSTAYEWARWHQSNKKEYTPIKVEIVSEQSRRWSPVISQLLTSDAELGLKTSYAYDYKIGQHIVYRDKWYQIEDIKEIDTDINPQAMQIACTHKQIIFSLSGVKDK